MLIFQNFHKILNLIYDEKRPQDHSAYGKNYEQICFCQTPDLGRGLAFDFTFAMEQ